MKPIGFVVAANPNGPQAGADVTADREIASPVTSTKPNGEDAFTSTVTTENSDSTRVLGWSVAAEFARDNPNRLDDASTTLTLVANPFRPQGGLFDRMPELWNSIPSVVLPPSGEGALPSDNWWAHKVLSEAPAMPMANLFDQIARAFPSISEFALQPSSNDAVTISAEAQAAADALDPPS